MKWIVWGAVTMPFWLPVGFLAAWLHEIWVDRKRKR
jgi:hypothetical protein